MKTNLFFAVVWMVVAGILASFPTVASGLQIVGDPIEGNSWRQRFSQAEVGTFDTLEVIMQVGSGFKPPGFDRFSDSRWSVDSTDKSYVLAIGISVSALLWDIVFEGDLSQPLSFCFRAWEGGLGGTLKQSVCASWRWGWHISNNNSIPDASMVWLLGSAFVGFAVFGMKKSKSKGTR